MTSKRMVYLLLTVAIAVVGALGWNLTARAAYESAEYKVVKSDGKFEIREYPDLILASTNTEVDSQGRDGSFMRLFRYISGANTAEQKISMTTPVFMQDDKEADGQMGFVVPKKVAAAGAPNPVASDVYLRERKGGRFAVIRFSGRMDKKDAKAAEVKLREWMETNGLHGVESAESAGYDPPFTPGPLRRNEVLIRLK
ncbi:MAG: heme-binding protein [Pirellulaceae bacterium]|nr:heme-binding protein [Pirellulaceae bacterium]